MWLLCLGYHVQTLHNKIPSYRCVQKWRKKIGTYRHFEGKKRPSFRRESGVKKSEHTVILKERNVLLFVVLKNKLIF